MPEICFKCNKKLPECTCYVCPTCQFPLTVDKHNEKGICPLCKHVFKLAPDDDSETSSLFTTFQNLFREIPLDEVKKTFKEEMGNALRRIAIKGLGGIPNEDMHEKKQKKVDYEVEDVDGNVIDIEFENVAETVRCPVCNTYVSINAVKSHTCFNKED